MCSKKMLLSKLVSVASEPNECCPEQSFFVHESITLFCCSRVNGLKCRFLKTIMSEMYTSKCACSNQIWYRFYCCVITLTPYLPSDWQCKINFLIGLFVIFPCFLPRAFLHGGGAPKIGEVTCGASPHLSCKRNQIYGQAGYPTYLGSPTFM